MGRFQSYAITGVEAYVNPPIITTPPYQKSSESNPQHRGGLPAAPMNAVQQRVKQAMDLRSQSRAGSRTEKRTDGTTSNVPQFSGSAVTIQEDMALTTFQKAQQLSDETQDAPVDLTESLSMYNKRTVQTRNSTNHLSRRPNQNSSGANQRLMNLP